MKTIDHIISTCGGAPALKDLLGLKSVAAVRQWRRNGFPMRHADRINRDFDIPFRVLAAACDPNATFKDPT